MRDVFTRDVNLPRGLEREIVLNRDREYTLRGSESRTLASIGAFRVVSSRDVLDHRNRTGDPRTGDLRHLREQGLIETVRVPGCREPAVVLTKEGRGLLESHRGRDQGHRPTFYAGLKRAREVEHDTHVFRAYLREADRLQERGARIDRVLLDYELKRDYQQWLHARDRDREDYDGHPDCTAEEIQDWAREHALPYFDDEVHFPDLRIEYQDPDGRWEYEDVEVTTPHYRGAHGASVARSGFVRFSASSVHVDGVDTPRIPIWPRNFSDDRRPRPHCHGVSVHERQARFLVLVMRHVGVCVPRQYARFSGIANGGKKCNAFFAKLVSRGHATPVDCVHNRARLNHLHSKALYHAIGEPSSRYRRPVAARQAVERLMLLDSPDLTWLTTDREKAAYLTTLTASTADETPTLSPAIASSSTRHQEFGGTFPIDIDPTGRPVLLYVTTVPGRRPFGAFFRSM